MATSATEVGNSLPKGPVRENSSFAYRMLWIFSLLYFGRPEDMIPYLGLVPFVKITGGIALLALVFGLKSRRSSKNFPTELKLLVALFMWQCLTIPFAWWRGGALNQVFSKCSKTVLIAFLVSLVVTSIGELGRLLFIQAAAVTLMTIFSVILYSGGRMGGVLGGVFDNPNDLAINIALTWPLCLMFLIGAKRPWKTLLWAIGLLFMMRGVMLTYSRSGFLALCVAIVFCLWEFGLRGKKHYLLPIAFVSAVLLVIVAPQNYGQRIQTIFGEPLKRGDSQEARKELLNESLEITATHPIFGIGPGNFEGYTKSWHVTHNTYTEFSAECGIPALILFLLVIGKAFQNLRRVRKLPMYAESSVVRLYTGGLWAALAGYLMGAFFASTAYQLFPYFLVGYTTALFRIASEHAKQCELSKPVSREWVRV